MGVITVDPSGPITSGALLGDRIRLQGHVEYPGVYVRSVAGRGHPGGLPEAVPRIATVLGMGPVRPWKSPVLETVRATEGVGVGSLWRAVERHRAHLQG